MRITAAQIENAVQAQCGRGYKMSLVGDDAKVVIEAVNVGIDAHLEAANIKERGDSYKPVRTKFINRLEACVSPESLAVLVRRLSEMDDGLDLATNILITLGFDVETGSFEVISRTDMG